jgi:hypothetical protein
MLASYHTHVAERFAQGQPPLPGSATVILHRHPQFRPDAGLQVRKSHFDFGNWVGYVTIKFDDKNLQNLLFI